MISKETSPFMKTALLKRFPLATFLASLFLFTPLSARSALRVVTSLPDLAWAAKEIGKDQVEVHSLLNGTEDPHYAEAVPEFIRQASTADALCFAGLDLEVGWLPKVLSRSGNAKIQSGGAGYCETGKGVEVLDKPSGPVDRSGGDTHPFGNPHFWLSPKAFGQGASRIAEVLSTLDPAHAKDYSANLRALQKKLDQLTEEGRKKLKPVLSRLQGPALIQYHTEFVYLLQAYGIPSSGSIEEKPGVAPSAGRIAEIASQAKASGVKLVLASPFSPQKTLSRFQELSGIPILRLSPSLQPASSETGLRDYLEHQRDCVEKLVAALSSGTPAAASPGK